jgi:hypothetical protein
MAGGNVAQTKNPFFSVGNQFLPRNLNDIIRWVRFITVQSPVTTEVIRKLATYPITSFTHSTRDPAVRKKYEEMEKAFKLKTSLADIGFQYFTVGNVFLSIYFPINRFYKCPSCGSQFGARHAGFLKFTNFKFKGVCPTCNHSNAEFTVHDIASKNIADMNLITWDPLDIAVHYNPITGKSKYYYKIPSDLKKKVQQGDRFFVDTLPWEIIEAIRDQKNFEFEDGFLYHLKNVNVGFSINGIAVPPLVCHFALVFYTAMLRRANESVATDYMAPLRAVFPQPQTGNSDPVVAVSMRNFVGRMEEAFVKHKQDNNHILIAPVPIGYQALSGEGKTLLVNAEIQQAEQTLLLSLGVSQELLSGTTNWTSSTVGLRLLENTLDSYVGQVLEFLEWMSSKTSSYLGIEKSTMGMTPFQLTDDATLQSILMALSQGGNVSMTTVFEAMGRSYEDELERIKEDAKLKARNDVRTQYEVNRAQYLEALEVGKSTEQDSSYTDALQEAQSMAQQLTNADPNTTRQVLDQLMVENYAMWLMVSKLLQENRTAQTQAINQQTKEGIAAEQSGGGGGPAAGGDPSMEGGGGAPPTEPGSGNLPQQAA